MITKRPILFTEPMLLAVNEDRKTQTRRKMRHQPSISGIAAFNDGEHPQMKCPYGKAGDELYVKEPFRIVKIGMGRLGLTANVIPNMVQVEYRPNEEYPAGLLRYVELSQKHIDMIKAWKRPNGWMSSLFMFEPLARTRLTVVEARVEKLNEISDEDCVLEGIYMDQGASGKWGWTAGGGYPSWRTPRQAYKHLIESVNGSDVWSSRYWWVVTFKRINTSKP